MTLLKAREAPPPNYYAANLREVVECVLAQYEDILEEYDRDVAYAILKLSTRGCRLLARLLTRKGTFVRLDRLKYSELDDLEHALQDLSDGGLIEINSTTDLEAIAHLFNRAELEATFEAISQCGLKNELVSRILNEVEEEDLLESLQGMSSWVEVTIRDAMQVLTVLFFGNRYADLSAFVLRDLGITTYESYALDREMRLFKSAEALRRYLDLADVHDWVHELGTDVDSDGARSVIEFCIASADEEPNRRVRDRVLNALGRNLERQDRFALALRAYEHSREPPARERRVRIHHRQGRTKIRDSILKDIEERPWTQEEFEFARRFGTHQKRTREFPSETIDLCCSVESIEDYAIQYLNDRRSRAFHFENRFPQALFGLTYWTWMFAPVTGAFANPFQAAPLDLYRPDFFTRRESLCSDPSANLDTLKRHIEETLVKKSGLANQFVDWSTCLDDDFRDCLSAIDSVIIERVLSIMKKDLKQMRAGFPDLTVLQHDGTIAFIEVKGPGDQLRRNQVIWLQRLRDADIPCKVLWFRAA